MKASLACDIRAVAGTLYEIITGTPPLYGTAHDAALINADGHPSPRRTQVLDQVDEYRPCHPARSGAPMAARLRERADHETGLTRTRSSAAIYKRL